MAMQEMFQDNKVTISFYIEAYTTGIPEPIRMGWHTITTEQYIKLKELLKGTEQEGYISWP